MYSKHTPFKPLELAPSDSAQTLATRLSYNKPGAGFLAQADPSSFHRSMDAAAVAAAASAPNVGSATRRAVELADQCSANAKSASQRIAQQAQAAHQAGYKRVASQLEAVASQIESAGAVHEQQAAHLRQIASHVAAGKPELAGFAGMSAPVPAQKVIAGLNPTLLRLAGAAYGYFLADRFLVSQTDPQRLYKIAAYAAVGAFSPVFGSMGLLLYSNLRTA